MAAHIKPFTLFRHGPSPNPFKVAIILEELGLPYRWENVEKSGLKTEPFISANPNGRVPALVDPNRDDFTLFESGAIIDYLIAEYDPEARLRPTEFREKHLARSWEHFQMSGQGPYFGQLGWFAFFHPEKVPSAIERYTNEIRRVTGVIDAHLAKQGTEYLVGDRVTYADLMFIPYFEMVPVMAPGLDLGEWENTVAWLQRMKARAGVSRALSVWNEERIKHQPQQESGDEAGAK